MIDTFVTWPMPLVWLLLASLLLPWRGIGGRLRLAAIVVLIVSSLPLVGRVLLIPFSHDVLADAGELSNRPGVAVVVPTAGTFRDASGRWWPQEGSIRRFAAGMRIAELNGLPLFAVGGSPYDNQPPEAETLDGLFTPRGELVRIVPSGRNSAESAAALGTLGEALPQPVILVTDRVHIARMRACLRAQGIAVAASIVPSAFDPKQRSPGSGPGWRDFVPSDSGLDMTAAVLREYVGIAWYLAVGHITLGDL